MLCMTGSDAIQLHLHRIPGLAPQVDSPNRPALCEVCLTKQNTQFIYFDDDNFVGRVWLRFVFVLF
jgi:hypothetical protein